MKQSILLQTNQPTKQIVIQTITKEAKSNFLKLSFKVLVKFLHYQELQCFHLFWFFNMNWSTKQDQLFLLLQYCSLLYPPQEFLHTFLSPICFYFINLFMNQITFPSTFQIRPSIFFCRYFVLFQGRSVAWKLITCDWLTIPFVCSPPKALY